ncbi:hypothetical protein LTR35_010502 [Friedmanniomyces endolithicus]|uniref:Amino acid permease/ SLC12A domain-containing protein n=1 Tax=Friedmanniomyces endolithicus TaxID=329885 RepID=A0AAN6FIG1_9PEZI|nr:hypothetical protein LTS00_017549 [Friedmanniomyces endolithicus]KAK0276179.1 hypothetical protein LTR35_010502 [Friedmanniomyces endolithicus]KAK0318874.1 hypothetical protein LTR82_010296 [Friedmanniomyces endolithicus]
MSEETRNAATTIPKVLLLTVGINGALALAFLIAVLYSIGDVNAALNTPTGYPIIEIFYQATGSKPAATAMESAIIIVACCAIFGTLASVSRLTWAFARDGGLPFSKFFAHVDSHHHVPTRAIALVTLVVVLLSLINIGSSTALNAVLSLSTLGLYVSYLIPISLLLLKRLRREQITFGPFKLGKCGLWINAYAIVFGVYISIFLPFPGEVPVTAVTMNYAGPVFGVVLILAALDWVFRGRKYYHGPIQEIAEVESP